MRVRRSTGSPTWSSCTASCCSCSPTRVSEWVQIDEPVLVTDIVHNAAELAERTYELLGCLAKRPAIFVATYFGALNGALPALARTPVEAIGVDLVAGEVVSGSGRSRSWPTSSSWPGIVDGRNIWRTDLEAALGTLATLLGSAGTVAVSTSCSTLHVPYTLDAETGYRCRTAQLAGVRVGEGQRGGRVSARSEGRSDGDRR